MPCSMAISVAARLAEPHAPWACPICDFNPDIGIFGGVLAQGQFERAGFHAVVHLSGSAVQIYVLNILRSERGLFERQGNCTCRFFRRIAHAHAVKSLAG